MWKLVHINSLSKLLVLENLNVFKDKYKIVKEIISITLVLFQMQNSPLLKIKYNNNAKFYLNNKFANLNIKFKV